MTRKKHSTTLSELKKEMLNTPEAVTSYEEAKRAWELKEILLQAREHANLTQAELARRMGLPASNLSRLENNPDRANIKTIYKYLSACNANIKMELQYA